MEVLETEESPVLGQRAREEGIGVDPKPEGLQLDGGDPSEVLDDMGGDVTALQAALGEAGVDSPVLGSKGVKVESPVAGGHEGGKGREDLTYSTATISRYATSHSLRRRGFHFVEVRLEGFLSSHKFSCRNAIPVWYRQVDKGRSTNLRFRVCRE